LKVLSFPIGNITFLITAFLFFFFFSATLENFKKVFDAAFSVMKSDGAEPLTEEEFQKMLDQRNFEKDVFNRKLLKAALRSQGFFQNRPIPMPCNVLQLQISCFFFDKLVSQGAHSNGLKPACKK
jgi:hypothetical protein